MVRYLVRKIQRWLCDHDQVLMKSGAKNKSGWDHYHKVTCRLCEKEFRMLGCDIAIKYSKEVECKCIFEK